MSHLIWIYTVCLLRLLFFSISILAAFFRVCLTPLFNTMNSSTFKVEMFRNLEVQGLNNLHVVSSMLYLELFILGICTT